MRTLEESKSFTEMEILINEMKLIRIIPIIESKTSGIYHSVIQSIIGIMRRIELETIKELEDSNKNIDYPKVFLNLGYLKDGEWIEQHKKGHYDLMIKNIKEKILEKSFELQNNVLNLDLDLPNYANIPIANNYLQKFYSTVRFESKIPELKEVRENTLKKFNDSVDRVLIFIKETFYLEKEDTKKVHKKIEELRKMRTVYESLHSLNKFLNPGNLNEIDAEINRLKQEIILNEKILEPLAEKIAPSINKNNKKKKHKTNQNEKGDGMTGGILQKVLSCFKRTNDNSENIDNLDAEEKNAPFKAININKNVILELERYKERLNDFKDKNNLNPNFKNLQELDDEIKNLQEKIELSNSDEYIFVFNRIDLVKAENSLKYLTACCSVRDIKDKSVSAKLDLENFMNEYQKYIEKESRSLLNKIEKLGTNDANLAFGYAQKLKNRLFESKDIEKHEKLKTLINCTEMRREIMSNLENKIIQLNDQLTQVAANRIDSKGKLEIIKALSQFDSFFEGKYFNLYREYQNKLIETFDDFYKKIIEDIGTHNYQNVINSLFSPYIDPIDKIAFNQIKNILSSNIIELYETTKSMAVCLKTTLEPESIQTIVDNLRKLENAKTLVLVEFDEDKKERYQTDSFVNENTQKILNIGVNSIENIISNKLKRYLNSIDALITADDFFEAEEKRNHFRSILFKSAIRNNHEIRKSSNTK